MTTVDMGSSVLPATIGSLFCCGHYSDAERIYNGRHGQPAPQWAFRPDGARLLHVGVKPDADIPAEAHREFKWLGLGEVTEETPLTSYRIPGQLAWMYRQGYGFRVVPRSADELYVVDHGEYVRRKAELRSQVGECVPFSHDERVSMLIARAQTLVPAADYAGGYAEPVLLVGRPLEHGEVELVSGPWPEIEHIRIMAEFDAAAENLVECAVTARAAYLRSYSPLDQAALRSRIDQLVTYFQHFGSDAIALAAQAYTEHMHYTWQPNADFIGRLVECALQARQVGLF